MSKHSPKRKPEMELPAVMNPTAETPNGEKKPGKKRKEEPKAQQRITQADVRRGIDLLKKYRAGKAQLEARVVDNEQWWKMRHWSVLKNTREPEEFESAWLFNCILNKHADAMDNYPEPVVLPREKNDVEDAQTLSEIMPVIMEQNGFEEVYDAAWWAKLKFGCGVYGVFWNTQKENGLGDIEIREVDLLNIFWEPGVEDIQRSANVFVVELWDKERLEALYPEAKNEPAGVTLTVSDYIHEDSVDKEGKVLVVDWYYKTEDKNGRTRLEYIKFVNDTLLFASENESKGFENGLYDHGKYPFVFDTLFPMAGSPAGFGYVDVCKKPQTMIDTLNKIITKNAWMSGKKRWFIKEGGGVNEEEYADWSKDFVHVQGGLGMKPFVRSASVVWIRSSSPSCRTRSKN